MRAPRRPLVLASSPRDFAAIVFGLILLERKFSSFIDHTNRQLSGIS